MDAVIRNAESITPAILKVQQLAKRRNVENWPGMLISAVPAYFDAPATELQRYRAEREHQQGRELEIARKILDDREAPEADKQWARTAIEKSTAPGASSAEDGN